MKRSNLAAGILYTAAGVLFLLAAILTDSKLDSLLFGFAGAGIGPGVMMLCQYFYWRRPENKERYQEMLENAKIEQNDELRVRLKERSGRCAYTLGLAAVSVSIVIFSVLGQLEIIANARMIVLYLGAYFVFQIIAGAAAFHHLLGKYR